MLKKTLFLAAVGIAGYLAYQKFNGAKEERDLWTEATTPPDLT
jgi:hypothetical protein